tara:strand:- start:685 stop:1311 length:627 start_codon:yes stop_codon:yes gene_type:complete
MKTLIKIISIFLFLIFLSCSKSTDEVSATTIEGYVLTEEGHPIADAQVGLFAMTNNFTSNSLQLIEELKTDEHGYYSFSSTDNIDIVSAAKHGYFDLEAEIREVENHQKNRKDIILNKGCKVNFSLQSPTDIEMMCLFAPFGSDCDFSYSSECFLHQNLVETSCYFVGGQSAVIEYQYEKNHQRGEKKDTLIFCPKGGEISLSLDYDF